MQQTERHGDLQEALRAMLSGFQSNIFTALPGIVQSYNAVKGTVVVQLAIQANVTNLDSGAVTPQTFDYLQDVPVCYIGGGGFVATFPIQQGDEALVIFSARCIDTWWTRGGVQPQAESRMHSLSDGFALVGPRSLAKSIPNVSTSTAQLRSLDGSTYVEVAGSQAVNVIAPGAVTVKSPTISMGASGSTPQTLMTDAFMNYWTTKVFPFLTGLGFTGGPAPTNSVTTNVKGA